MLELLPPQTLKFSGGESTSFLNSLIKAPPDWSRVRTFDITDVTFITPVIASIAGVFNSLGWDILPPRNKEARSYLDYMLGVHEDTDATRYIPVINCAQKIDVLCHAEKIRSILRGWVSSSVAEDINYSLSETMDNVFDHARSAEGLWLQTQKYPNLNKIEIALIDRGRGVAQSLADNPAFSGLSDEDRFGHALELGVSANPSCHSGEGLSSTLEWLKKNRTAGARAVLISMNNLFFTGKTTTGVMTLENICWPGTFLWFAIPYNPPVSLSDTWVSLGLSDD
jgi:hypothetical protein